MKFIDWLFGDLLENIVHKGDLTELVWNVPNKEKEIRYNTKLKVPKDFVALVKLNKDILDILESGAYRLNRISLPNIAQELGWNEETDDPFNADIYYINNLGFEVKFKNGSPILIRDLRNNIIKLNSNGFFICKIIDYNTFLNHIMYKKLKLDNSSVSEYLAKLFIALMPDILANRVLPLSKLLEEHEEFINFLIHSYNEKLNEIGLQISHLTIKTTNIEEKNIYTGIDKDKKRENKNVYYIIQNSKESGPYTKSDILWMLDNFELNPNSYIWREGLNNWLKIRDLMDFE